MFPVYVCTTPLILTINTVRDIELTKQKTHGVSNALLCYNCESLFSQLVAMLTNLDIVSNYPLHRELVYSVAPIVLKVGYVL